MTSFFRKLIWLIARRRREAEIQEELAFHLEEEAEQLRAQGLAADQANYAARRDLGNFTLVEENTRAMWTWTSVEQLVQDPIRLQQAGRRAVLQPGATLVDPSGQQGGR